MQSIFTVCVVRYDGNCLETYGDLPLSSNGMPDWFSKVFYTKSRILVWLFYEFIV